MKKFFEWSVNNWLIYSPIGIVQWRSIYVWVCSLVGMEVNLMVGFLLICFQFFGLVMLLTVLFTAIKRR